MTPRTNSPGLFLDRDGVVIVEVDHLCRPDQVRLISGSARTIAEINRRQIPVVLVTNQAGIAKGLYSRDDFHAVQRTVAERLARREAHLDACYFCPHHPDQGTSSFRQKCSCRKPAPGMLQMAAAQLLIDLSHSVMVGDKRSDLEAGRAAGCRTLLVRTGYGCSTESELIANSRTDLFDKIADNLGEALPWLLVEFGRQKKARRR